MHQLVESIPLMPRPARRTVELRPATVLSDAEQQTATGFLAAAFDGSPLLCAAFPQPETRREVLQIMFTAVLKDAIDHGRIELAYNGQLAGMLIWYPPGRYPLSLFRTLRL